MLLAELTTHDLISIGPRLVGATFIWSAGIKAVVPHTFFRHLASLGWIPRKLLSPAVTAAAALEAGLGTALVVGAAPAVILPMTLVVLVVLSFISWWGVRSGKATDCGCYGGFIQPTIAQSVGLNGLFALLVLAAWSFNAPFGGLAAWQLALPIVAALLFGAFAEKAQRFLARTGQPMVDMNPLKAGRRWRHSWANGETKNVEGEVIVAFLGPDCPFCGNFVKIGNAMIQSPNLPRVIGVVATTKDRFDAFIRDKGIRFPIARISQSLMNRLVSAVPTAVVVESGMIKRIWAGDTPADVVDRFRDAFFPVASVGRSDSAQPAPPPITAAQP